MALDMTNGDFARPVGMRRTYSATLAIIVVMILFGIASATPVAWAHSGSLDEDEKQAILLGVAAMIAFVALIWMLAKRHEKRRDRRAVLRRKRGG